MRRLDLEQLTHATDDDASLAVRAAWLHFGAGLTQAEVARRLGVPSLKAHRLIARANRDGLVKITIDGDISSCVQLEDRLCERYGVQFCQVAPTLNDEPLPLRALGLAGSRFLRLALESGDNEVIGVGHGRTLAAVAGLLPKMSLPGAKLVSLLGSVTGRFAATPFDVIHKLAERTGAEAYVLPVPFYANSTEDRAVLLAQKGVRQLLDLGVASTLRLVGIGTMEGDASLLVTGLIEPEEFEAARRAGGAGEMLGHIFDADGRLLDTELTARTLSMAAEDIGRERTVAIAGGRSKVAALKAVLASKLLFGLITDERTAQAMLA